MFFLSYSTTSLKVVFQLHYIGIGLNMQDGTIKPGSFMVALCNSETKYIFILFLLLSSSSFFFFLA